MKIETTMLNLIFLAFIYGKTIILHLGQSSHLFNFSLILLTMSKKKQTGTRKYNSCQNLTKKKCVFKKKKK